jgi:hypothetical protein
MKKILLLLCLLSATRLAIATGEPATFFNIYVPPNNDNVRRDVALIVTAIYDSTAYSIVDDGMDGDTDDSARGYLMAGQSYVLYIRDNGVNDDAKSASTGLFRQDGDYFLIYADKIVYASQSTDSDWQHDWVPSINKSSLGDKFILYAPKYSSSKRDINVFAYEDNTAITVKRVSTGPLTTTGYTSIRWDLATVVATRTLNKGEDIIYTFPEGRDLLDAGHTYVIETSKSVTMQYGALYGNERDGGGYVPGNNGSSSAELFYFAVPYQSGTLGEQEIRIVSWDDANSVSLERYNAGRWIAVKSMAMNKYSTGEWVGKTNGNINYPTVFRLTCSAGKKASVFEGNWFETGSPGTSDMATMVSSERGTTAGTKFLTYMPPPGNEQNARDPFTGNLIGQQLSHLYIFAKDSANVTVKDAFRNGVDINRTYRIGKNKYVDCALTLTEWKAIYNGTGKATGTERPYLVVESDKPISVMNSNFNDNWMMYFGSSEEQKITQQSTTNKPNPLPGDTVKVIAKIFLPSGEVLNHPKVEVLVATGLDVISSKLLNRNSGEVIDGQVLKTDQKTTVLFDSVPALLPNQNYEIETIVVVQVAGNNSTPLLSSAVGGIETIVSGTIGGSLQQSVSTEGIRQQSNVTTNLFFSKAPFSTELTDSWNCSWVDYDNDGDDDIFVTEQNPGKANYLYQNNNGTFTKITTGPLVNNKGITKTSTWADADNDGDIDVLIINNTRTPNIFYKNQGNGIFVADQTVPFGQDVSYYHSGAFADYDRDGKLDIFLCNYWPTRYNELFHAENGGYVKQTGSVLPQDAFQTTGATWADYDNDGFADLFMPNKLSGKNVLYHNMGNGRFERVSAGPIVRDGGFSVGSIWGDIDNDGDLDLYVTNASNKVNYLYRNNGNGAFTKDSTDASVQDKGHHHGCSFADIDNDGDLDIYVTTDQSWKRLYINDGTGHFKKKENEVLLANFGKAFGHAWSDFDRDGDLDLFVATHSNQPNYLFTNNGNSNSWLNIRLQGSRSNKSGIGARVRVKGQGQVWQMREVNSQSGFGGQNSLRQHFGLGVCPKIDSIEVIWPSGIRQVVTNQFTNQFITLSEPSGTLVTGKLFHDADNNCTHSQSEPLLANRAVIVQPGNRLAYTDIEGRFSLMLENGNYTLAFKSEKGWRPACADVVNFTTNGLEAMLELQPLALRSTCIRPDLQVNLGTSAFRRGFRNTVVGSITNNGAYTAKDLTFDFYADANLIPTASAPVLQALGASSRNGYTVQHYQVMLDSLQAGKNWTLEWEDSLSIASRVGDTLYVEAYANSLLGDCEGADNLVIMRQPVVGAIDPNDLAVSPSGYGRNGLIREDQRLTYKVRFENVGTHYASRVSIMAHLPIELDINTLKLESSSHNGRIDVDSKRNLSWNFNNIYLPDTGTDRLKSQGFAIFSIEPLKKLPAGTQISMKAYITFDFEDAIGTNWVRNTIENSHSLGGAVLVSPNPSDKEFSVSVIPISPFAKPIPLANIKAINANGQEEANWSCNGNLLLSVKHTLVPGIYILEAIDIQGTVYRTRFIVK